MASFRRGNAAALLLAFASVAHGSLTPASAAGLGAVVFQRMEQAHDGSVRASNLWIAAPAGVRQLTPATVGQLDSAAMWSPSGTRIVFTHGSAIANPAAPSEIRVIDAGDRKPRALTSGAGSFRNPVWGPGDRLAFTSVDRGRNCLSVVQLHGKQQLHLFCLPVPAEMLRPVWSADGRSIYLQAGYYTGSLEPHWRSLAYRIDAATGAPYLLADAVLDESRVLEFSPDGRRGIYADVLTNEMVMVDFASGRQTDVGMGYAPRWSKDGRRIAFSREVLEFANPSDVRDYDALFVMNADGSGVRRVTQSRLNNHAYTAVEWSDDGTRLLSNRRIYIDPSLTIARYTVRIVDVATGATTVVADGFADRGAWREH